MVLHAAHGDYETGRILVVEPHADELVETLDLLDRAGYRVTGTTSFDEARRYLLAYSPQLLVTDVQLGAYNGMHLILRGRCKRPELAAILTHHSDDPVLRNEAEKEQIPYLVRPCTKESLLALVASCLKAPIETERLPASNAGTRR